MAITPKMKRGRAASQQAKRLLKQGKPQSLDDLSTPELLRLLNEIAPNQDHATLYRLRGELFLSLWQDIQAFAQERLLDFCQEQDCGRHPAPLTDLLQLSCECGVAACAYLNGARHPDRLTLEPMPSSVLTDSDDPDTPELDSE